MGLVFFFCALIAGTIFVVQFVMTIVGLGGEHLDSADGIAAGDLDDFHTGVHDHGSTWLFGVISFRTLIAAAMFFGLVGMAMLEAGQTQGTAIIVASTAGLAAMYGVHFLMQMMLRLKHDGTARVERSIGKRGTVYVPVPGGKAGVGKVQLRLRNRIMEYRAMTAGADRLATGTPVEVVDIVSANTVEVKAVEPQASEITRD